MRLLAIACCAALLGACASPPVQLGPRPDIAGIRVQNQETIKQTRSTQEHVTKFRESNRTVQKEAVETENSLEAARKYLTELLDES